MAERSIVEVLRAARERISDPEHWTRGVAARSAKGGPKVPVHSEEAVCWCLNGALMRESGGRRRIGLKFLLAAIREKHRYGCNVTTLNDSYGHAEVLAALDRAIELAEAEE